MYTYKHHGRKNKARLFIIDRFTTAHRTMCSCYDGKSNGLGRVYSPVLIDLAATMSRQRRGKKRRVNSAPKAIKTRGRALGTVLTDTR